MTTAVLSLLTVASGQPSQMDAGTLYRRAKDSVVGVEVTTKDGMAFGTGFFFGDQCTVATCEHVVQGATKIVIRGTHGSSWMPASMSVDHSGDTALLHLRTGSNRVPLKMAKASQIGDSVFVIGNPLGMLTGSLTTGIVSAHRQLDTVPILQTTAPISEGSSGSPVLDNRGRVLGMVSFTFSEGQNLNMAIGSKVLSWVARGGRSVPLPAYYATNMSSKGAALRFDPKTENTSVKAAAAARVALIAQVAQYDGRVIDAFVRWQEAAIHWQKAEAGVKEADVDQAYQAFRTAISSEEPDRAMQELAKSSGQTAYLKQLHAAADSLIHVAADKYRQDADVVHGANKADAQKRDRAEYARTVEAVCEFGAAGEDPSWMNVDMLYENFPTSAKGECIMLHQDAYVDADLPHSTSILAVLPGSIFREGDIVRGARLTGQKEWTPVDSWEDLWQFTTDNGEHLCQKGWEVQVVRGGKMASLPMCLASRRH